MGGYGSTRWGWHSTRATTDEVLALDIRLLARHGVFTADHGDVVRRTISWTAWGEETGRISFEYAGATPQRITLHYCVHGPGEQTREVTKSIAVGRTACHFGGERVWFICPDVPRHGRCFMRSAECSSAASAMISPIARRESHRVSEYGGMVAGSADLLKRIQQAT